MPRHVSARQGFTLLELTVALTVFAIIGLASHAMSVRLRLHLLIPV
jgi:prepilin-type N-terminal cleavage/methylation domain-containing protein